MGRLASANRSGAHGAFRGAHQAAVTEDSFAIVVLPVEPATTGARYNAAMIAPATTLIEPRYTHTRANTSCPACPSKTTRVAIPTAAPTCRDVWLNALPIPYRSGGRNAFAAATSVAIVMPTPVPINSCGTKNTRQYAGADVVHEASAHVPSANRIVPGTASARCPYRSASRPAGAATAAAASGPGVRAMPAPRI